MRALPIGRRTFLKGALAFTAGCSSGMGPGARRAGRRGYDVVIVGGGTAGCVLAARLSEDPRRTVLVIEAGADFATEASLPPGIRGSGPIEPEFDWDYSTDEHGTPPRKIGLPRGKVMGGCSATNAMTALRGHPVDYDEWSTDPKSPWRFNRLLPFFRKLERDADFHDEWHGSEGPVPITRVLPDKQTDVMKAFVAASLGCKHPVVQDHNRPRSIGVGPMPRNQLGGVRQSTALTYLSATTRARKNLTIRANTLVDTITFHGNRATGVRLAAGGEVIEAGQVLVSAGAYGSPHLLMRSGIGPAALLRTHSIPVVADRPGVGQNLLDHPLVFPDFALKPGVPSVPFVAENVLSFHSSAPPTAAPDLQLIPLQHANSITFVMSVMKPSAVGSLRLASRDPRVMPVIDHNYLGHAADERRMLEVMRELRRIMRSSPMKELVAEELSPGSAAETDAALLTALRDRVQTYFHAVGTCKLGPTSDPRSVIDERLRVHGIEHLMVCDASSIPTLPSVNTNLSVIAVAECGATLL